MGHRSTDDPPLIGAHRCPIGSFRILTRRLHSGAAEHLRGLASTPSRSSRGDGWGRRRQPIRLATIPSRRASSRNCGLPASGTADPRVRVVHRLDKETSGVLLFALDSATSGTSRTSSRTNDQQGVPRGRWAARRDRGGRRRVSAGTRPRRCGWPSRSTAGGAHGVARRAGVPPVAAARVPQDRQDPPDPRAPEIDRPAAGDRPALQRAGRRACCSAPSSARLPQQGRRPGAACSSTA